LVLSVSKPAISNAELDLLDAGFMDQDAFTYNEDKLDI
jgi:hypothetical protein